VREDGRVIFALQHLSAPVQARRALVEQHLQTAQERPINERLL
jgi:hypothetical protein